MNYNQVLESWKNINGVTTESSTEQLIGAGGCNFPFY